MEPRPSRRNVLVGGAAAAAAVLAGCTSDGTPDDSDAPDAGAVDPARRTVVVVGGGLAGLTCALDLLDAGWSVTVVEAGDRVGGRVRTLREPFADGLHAEAGGESIDVDHTDLLALVERFGLATEDRPPNKIVDGATQYRGRRWRTADFVASGDGAVAADYERFYAALDELGEGIDPEHPDQAEGAAELDARTMADLLDELDLVAEARFLAETDIRSGFNAELEDLSQLFVAQQWAVGTDVSDEGVEAMRIRGGNDRLPAAMADRVVELGGEVVLGRPVTAIGHDGDGVRVEVDGGAWSGAWAVVACPFTAARRIGFEPELPADLAAAVDGLDLGPAAKVIVEYEERFWEGLGQSGFTVTDEPFGVGWSPTDSYPSERGLLAAFLTGSAAVDAAAREDEARIDEVAAQLDVVYPEGAELRTGNAATVAWANEPFAGGGYAVYRPGQVTDFWAAIRAGAGRLRFAGEHTEALAGYMESAVRSGHRVATELGDPPDG
ncbi:MAG: FAD-dependent oxidoreductase [Acidimicrobiales bacterium]|nr:FAD-dependent oxidoreductase [Acidimicrobiales bacterium]